MFLALASWFVASTTAFLSREGLVLTPTMNRGFVVLNGFIVVSFYGKERKVDLNGFLVVTRRRMASIDRFPDSRYIRSI